MRKQLVVLCLWGALAGGCASKRDAGPSFRAGDERMPEFLNGPAVVLLTNSTGYSARLETDILRPYGDGRSLAGMILQRQGRLVFQPDQVSTKKRPSAGLIFIWDANQREGCTLSEALQGYAPAESSPAATNVQIDATSIQEVINNHPCHRLEARITRADGSVALYKVWQADDLRHFPIRIQSESGGRAMTLDFSNLLFDSPPETLFNPPDGFVKYTNPSALMNELIIRETTIGERLEATEYAAPPPPRAGAIMTPEPAR